MLPQWVCEQYVSDRRDLQCLIIAQHIFILCLFPPVASHQNIAMEIPSFKNHGTIHLSNTWVVMAFWANFEGYHWSPWSVATPSNRSSRQRRELVDRRGGVVRFVGHPLSEKESLWHLRHEVKEYPAEKWKLKQYNMKKTWKRVNPLEVFRPIWWGIFWKTSGWCVAVCSSLSCIYIYYV